MIVMGGDEHPPAIDHRRIDDGHAEIVAATIRSPVAASMAIDHAEAGGDENLAGVIGDAAAHAAGGIDGVGLAQQAPQGRHVGAVLGRQALVPHRVGRRWRRRHRHGLRNPAR